MKTRTLIWILAIWLASLAVMMLVSGCKTTSRVERIQIHDTIVRVQHDTAHIYNTISRTDTVKVEERVEIVKNVAGDTIRVERWRDRWRDRWNVDTIIIYKAKEDSARETKTEQTAAKIKEKPRNTFFLLCVALIVVGICVYTIRKR